MIVLDVNFNSTHLYFVGASNSAVIDVDLTLTDYSSLVNGVNQDTATWVDSNNEIFYYSGLDRIDSVDSEKTWKSVIKNFPFEIDYMTGDSTTGNLIIVAGETIIQVVPSTGEYSTLIDSVQQGTPIAVSSGMIYFTTPSQSGGIVDVNHCQIALCTPDILITSDEAISSLSVDEQGNLFYATIFGIFPTTGYDPSAIILATDNIMPFSMTYDVTSNTAYYLDISLHTQTYQIVSCDLSQCSDTLQVLMSETIPSNAKFELNGWLVSDSTFENLYWSASSLSDIYVVEIASGTNSVVLQTGEKISGLDISDDNILFVSNGVHVLQYQLNGTLITTCYMSTSDFQQPPPVGDIELYDNLIFWADASTGDIYECLANCTDSITSTLVDSGNPSCTAWQFITSSDGVVFNQYGCGGITQANINETGIPVALKPQGVNPISDLIVENPSLLVWSLPYRYSILQGSISNGQITDITTTLSGTGTFSNLIANSGIFYWLDVEAAKIVYTPVGASPKDFAYQPAVGLSYGKNNYYNSFLFSFSHFVM